MGQLRGPHYRDGVHGVPCVGGRGCWGTLCVPVHASRGGLVTTACTLCTYTPTTGVTGYSLRGVPPAAWTRRQSEGIWAAGLALCPLLDQGVSRQMHTGGEEPR